MNWIRNERFYFFLGWFLTIGSVFMLLVQGIERSYFHQDDIVELTQVSLWKGWPSVFLLNNEHLNITFWPILRAQWLIFGMNFTPYLVTSVLLHLAVLFLIFIICYKLTKSFLWSSIPVWGMVINANWFSVVWWITGQMIMLCTLFALVSYWLVLNAKEYRNKKYYSLFLFIASVLPGMSWGIGLSWPIWPLLIYGIDYKQRKIDRVGITLVLAQLFIAVVYFSLTYGRLGVHSSPSSWFGNLFGPVFFTIIGSVNTVIGRWIWPGEKLKIRFFCMTVIFVILLVSKKIRLTLNRNVIFGVIVLLGSFMTIALPRWNFNPTNNPLVYLSMPNYYAYFPLPFLLISAAIFFSVQNFHPLSKILVISVFLIHIPLSWLSFEVWAKDWVVRPQMTKVYFNELTSLPRSKCLENNYLPLFIIPKNIYRLDYIWPIFKQNNDPFCK